jgi:ribosomal-protein-alanine N-acetyltransferase
MSILAINDPVVLAEIHDQAFDDPWSAPAFAALLASPGVSAFGTGDGSGFILCRVVAEEAEILTLAVTPPLRRGGVAKALVEAGAQAAFDRGARSMFLEVAADNTPAIALYDGAGFTPVGRRVGYYRRPDGAIDALVLRRDLNTGPSEPYA